MMRLAILFAVGLSLALSAAPLDAVFTAGTPWTLSQSAVAELLPGVRLAQLESGKSLLAHRQSLTLFGMPVHEWRAAFRGGRLCRMDVSFFNKGDDTSLVKPEEFNARVKRCIASLQKVAAAPARKPVCVPAGTQVRYEVWEQTFITPGGKYILSWAFRNPKRRAGRIEPFQAEFINASYQPETAPPSASAKPSGELSLRQNVAREPDGDVWIRAIPMVDQGNKGYCAVSTAERIFSYFRLEIDQHFFAMLAETERGGGTSFGGISGALQSAGRKYELDVTELVVPYRPNRDFLRTELGKIFSAYNRAAPRDRRLKLEDFTRIEGRTRVLDILDLYAKYDPAILRKARTEAQSGAYTKFKNDIRRYVDAGIPLMWDCVVGIYPEVPALNMVGRPVGGPIRLIIGYNDRTGEILYSDSWGAGHAKKRMTAATAWAMTTGLCVAKPRSVR